MRCNADPAEIESIRVPARLNCGIRMRPLVSMPLAGANEKTELVVVQNNQFLANFLGKSGGTRSMIGIVPFREALRIVQNREVGHNVDVRAGFRCESQTVLEHTRPVHDAMQTVRRKLVPI